MSPKPEIKSPVILSARIVGIALVTGALCTHAQELPQRLAQSTIQPPQFRAAEPQPKHAAPAPPDGKNDTAPEDSKPAPPPEPGPADAAKTDAPAADKPGEPQPAIGTERPAPAEPAPAELAPDQAAPPPAEPAPEGGPEQLMSGPSPTFAVNLLKVMVKKGLLTQTEADVLIQEAAADTALAQQQAIAVAQTTTAIMLDEVTKSGQLAPAGPAADDIISVPYIPEVVKKQIRDELRADLAQQAKDERWASAVTIPDWVSKFRVKGDIRLRYEGNYFPTGNDNTGSFPNFNAINTGAPFDVSGTVFSPQLNVDEDRQRFRLRLRLGAEVDMGDGFTAGMRLATGQDNSPTSPNQSFGIANNASGGNFSKYAVWIDRAFLKYEAANDKSHFTALGGRFDNPFFTTDTIFDDDLGFDGFAFTAKHKLGAVTPFVTAGAFPIFNTDFNFSSNQPDKFDSTDKYLYGAQIGADAKLTKDLTLKIAAAYYDFDGVRGEQSTPYTPLSASDAGDTDGTRPSFAQKGNTYIPLRRIIPNANNNFGTSNQFQYFGLGTDFRPIAITGKLEYNGFEPVQVVVTGEYIRNTAFDRDRLNALGVNNRAPRSAGGSPGSYAGGDTAWMLGIRAGHAAMQKRGDWQVGAYYKHIESDAVVDAFTDSDFGLGGTNLKGFGIFGTWAVSPRAAFGVRWISASEIAGPPLRNDTLQLDFTGRF